MKVFDKNMNDESKKEEEKYNFSETKQQTTLHLSELLLEKIEEKLYFARKNLPRAKRGKLSKSKFYELIIEAIIADDKLISKIIGKWERS